MGGEKMTLPSRSSVLMAGIALAAQSALAITGDDACRLYEKVGNADPAYKQECMYQKLPSGAGAYVLWFKGDYGDDYLLLANFMLGKLVEIDREVPASTSAVTLTFTDVKTRLGTQFTAQLSMPDLRTCMRKADEGSRRICVTAMITRAAKNNVDETERLMESR